MFTSATKEEQAQVQSVLGEKDHMYLDDPIEYVRHYRRLLKEFGGSTYALGTVGAMVLGCAQSQSPTAGCHPLCADALPYPIETEKHNSHCMDAVVTVISNVMHISCQGHTRERILMYVDTPTARIVNRDMDKLFGVGTVVDIILLRTGEVLYKDVPIQEMGFMIWRPSATKRYVKLIIALLMVLCLVIIVYTVVIAK